MNFSKGPSFDTLRALETAPNMYLVLSPDLYILTASDLYLEAVSAKRSDIVSKHIFEAFPANPELPEADGVQNINASLQEVLRTKKQHFMTIQRYDVPDINNPGKFIQRYWDPTHKPILDSQGNIEYIIQLATNVSDKVLTERALVRSQLDQANSIEQLKVLNNELLATNIEFKETQQDLSLLNAELEDRVARRTLALAASEQKFRSLIENNPIAMQVYRGEEMRFEINNEAMLHFLGKTADINGKTIFEAVPEIIGQPIIDKLYHVFRTGEPLELKAEQVSLQRNGKKITGYYDVTYRALYEDDQITGILGIAIDVTTQIVALQELEASDEKLKIAIETGKMGTWSIDLDSLKIETSDFVKKLLGLQPQKTYVPADFLSLINASFQTDSCRCTW